MMTEIATAAKDLPNGVAAHLRWARMIKDYWAHYGLEVDVQPTTRDGYHSIRSNMINGLPRTHKRVRHLL